MQFINALRSRKTETTSTPEKLKVFIYKTREFESIPFNNSMKCEDVCVLCCKLINILPTARLLFGLRVVNSEEWLFPTDFPKTDVKYEFRMRFKVPELDVLKTIDKNAYEYLYTQIRYDMVHDRIDEIRYPIEKDKVVGLAAVDMYIDYVENKKISVESIEKNYKQYLPATIVQKHRLFVKNIVLEGFKNIRNTDKGFEYARTSYMHSFADCAPNYLIENFNATVDSLPDGGVLIDRSKKYPVTVNVDLLGDGGPSIKISLFKNQWLVVTKLENINALYLDTNQLGVRININGLFREYHLKFNKPHESRSFMSYVSGYSRLTTKWMFDPCVNFAAPSLVELKTNMCHGPIGGDFSYAKIRELGKGRGTFLVRQCEVEYDTYSIDIFLNGKKPETFKITKNDKMWFLHMNEIKSFGSLLELAKAIPAGFKFRHQMPPCDYDKPPLLLICVPRHLIPKTVDYEMNPQKLQGNRPQIFDPKKDLQWYIHSQTRSDCGKMTCRLAEWIQPNGVKNVKVTLKILNDNQDFGSFMELTNVWSAIYSADFLKMYGLTLTSPNAVIVEYAKYGRLNKLLQKNDVSTKCLLDVANGLVRAVGFMQEKRIMHRQIRCSSLMVTDFCLEKNILIAKLADPGIKREFDPQKDLPWLPLHFYANPAQRHQLDLESELWAFATTMWEIFARGEDITYTTAEELTQNYKKSVGILPIPEEWPAEIQEIIMNGWSPTGIRFDKMDILKKLSDLIKLEHPTSNSETNPTNIDDDNRSLTLSTSSNENDHTCPFPSGVIWDQIPTVQLIQGGKLISKKMIGEGHYGRVYSGEIVYTNNERVEVAIKVLKNLKPNSNNAAFDREIRIMQSVNHPNIVKIIMATYRAPMSIVMEYLHGGSFNVYLSSQKPNLTNDKLLQFSLAIAKGMEYLGQKGIIHRDLAARNILIDGEIVKISDFGLAQQANNEGYYMATSSNEIPIKWYALESLLSNKFSTCSDVWSYGVTLFEIFSRGEEPNLSGLEGHRLFCQSVFISRLERGDRLQKPELCPQIVYEKIMVPCWDKDKHKRPKFSDIIKIIEYIQNEYTEHI